MLGLTFILYLPRIVCWFGSIRKQVHYTNAKKNKICVLIPARNEPKTIENLFMDLKKQDYDQDSFEVYVIVANKKDPNISLIKKYGYNVHICETQKRKGDALDSAIKTILKTNNIFDAYLIIDADCGLKENYLTEMNDALASNRQIILSKKVVKNYTMKDKNALSIQGACNGIIWTLIDEMGNRFKSDHYFTGMTIGTGLMIRKDVVQEWGGWNYKSTLTEDIELEEDMAVKGYTFFYASYALMYMEEAPSLKVTNKRRTRWMSGVVDSTRLYEDKLKKSVKGKGIKAHLNKYYVQGCNYAYYFIGVSVIYSIVALITSLITLCSGYFTYSIQTLFVGILAILVIYLSFFIMTMVAMIVDHKHIKTTFINKIKILFLHPIFYMGYIKIVFKALAGINDDTWEAIERVPSGELPK